MHILLSFISGLGPRKAKKFIQNLKKMGRKISVRSDIYINSLLVKEVYVCAIGFLKIKIPSDELSTKYSVDIMD